MPAKLCNLCKPSNYKPKHKVKKTDSRSNISLKNER